MQDTRPGDNISEEMDDQFENDDYIDGDMLLELAAMEDEGEEEEDDISQLTQVVGNHNLAAGPSTDRPMCDTSIVKQEAEYLSSANNATPLQRASVVGKADFWLNHQGFAYVKVCPNLCLLLSFEFSRYKIFVAACTMCIVY